MSNQINLKEAERSTFKLATYTDGLNDISLGLVLILLSLYSVTRSFLGPVLNAIAFISATLIVVGAISYLKKRLVPPRVGLVKFGPQVKKRLQNALIATSVLLIATLATWVLSAKDILQEPAWERLPQWATDFDIDIAFSILIIAFFCALAYSFAMPRFYLYGLLIGLGNLSSIILLVNKGIKFEFPLAFAGLVIAGFGVLLLIRFLNNYSIPSEEA